MKYLILLLGFWFSGLAFAGVADVKLLPFKSYQTPGGTELLLTFDLPCNAQFLKVVRVDTRWNTGDLNLISVAGLISLDDTVFCQGTQELVEDAGAINEPREPYEVDQVSGT
jgi:hypothetical protein